MTRSNSSRVRPRAGRTARPCAATVPAFGAGSCDVSHGTHVGPTSRSTPSDSGLRRTGVQGAGHGPVGRPARHEGPAPIGGLTLRRDPMSRGPRLWRDAVHRLTHDRGLGDCAGPATPRHHDLASSAGGDARQVGPGGWSGVLFGGAARGAERVSDPGRRRGQDRHGTRPGEVGPVVP
jgi:hypothetical protein